MRRLLPLVLAALLLSGCSAGITPPTPGPVYNGEPTQLVVRLEREEVRAPSFRDDSPEEADMVYIHIIKRDFRGTIIYQDRRAEPLPSGQTEIELPFEVPAEEGYEIDGHSYRGGQLLGVIDTVTVDAPAKTLTTASVPLVVPSCEFTVPAALYSGGDLRQLRFSFSPTATAANGTLFMSFTPWSTNMDFWHPDPGVPLLFYGDHLPSVDQPVKLYYQAVIHKSAEQQYGGDHCFQHYPNLSTGDELLFVWVYPDPSWTE